MISVLLTLLIMPVSNLGLNHAIYISVIEMSESEVSIKVFSDDLQDVIRNNTKEYQESDNQHFLKLNTIRISKYFNEKCELTINGTRRSLKLESLKMESDASFLYFSFENESKWSNMTLKADYFMELFPNQSNVLTIEYDQSKYYSRLTKENSNYTLNLD